MLCKAAEQALCGAALDSILQLLANHRPEGILPIKGMPIQLRQLFPESGCRSSQLRLRHIVRLGMLLTV